VATNPAASEYMKNTAAGGTRLTGPAKNVDFSRMLDSPQPPITPGSTPAARRCSSGVLAKALSHAASPQRPFQGAWGAQEPRTSHSALHKNSPDRAFASPLPVLYEAA
jgi:hypothetical protein